MANTAADQTGDKLDRLLNGMDNLMTRIGKVEALHDSAAGEQKKDSERFDALMSKLDSVEKRMDACEKRMDTESEEEKEEKVRADKARKDAEDKEKEDEAKKDAKAKKDESEGGSLKKERDEKREDSARHDSVSVDAKTWAEIQAKIAQLDQRTTVLADADLVQFVETQKRANGVYQAFGDSAGARRWLPGESLQAYRCELAGGLKKHSAVWNDIDLSGLRADVLTVAEAAIYADADMAARAPVAGPGGSLRRVVSSDAAGRQISKFYGDPESCWGPFKDPVIRVLGGFGLKQH